jgi:hypothetical protein
MKMSNVKKEKLIVKKILKRTGFPQTNDESSCGKKL